MFELSVSMQTLQVEKEEETISTTRKKKFLGVKESYHTMH